MSLVIQKHHRGGDLLKVVTGWFWPLCRALHNGRILTLVIVSNPPALAGGCLVFSLLSLSTMHFLCFVFCICITQSRSYLLSG